MDIAPGTTVAVEIRSTPRKEAAIKTLNRVCGKDPSLAKARRERKEKRPSWTDKRRGGRFWHHQMKSRSLVKLEPGQTYEVRATLDVIRDLESVERWINVTPR